MEHVPRIFTPCHTRYLAFEHLSFDRDTFDPYVLLYASIKRLCILTVFVYLASVGVLVVFVSVVEARFRDEVGINVMSNAVNVMGMNVR